MAENVFEDSDYTVQARITTGIVFKDDYKGKVDLEYLKNNKVVKTDADQDVTKGIVTKVYKVPKVENTELKYELKIRAKYGDAKEKTENITTATVWPQLVKIHAKDDKDKDVTGFTFRVLQSESFFSKDTVILDSTDDKGKCEVWLRLKAPYKIEALAPFEIKKAEETNKREHELTVVRNYKAKFVGPVVTAAPYELNETGAQGSGYRQYVNMTTASEGSDAKGNLVTIKVCGDSRDLSLADDPIYFEVTFGRESKRTTPEPEVVTDPAVYDLQKTNSNKTQKGYVKLDSDRGTASFQVNLGLAGGDTCTIKIGGTKADVNDASLKFVNWRKLAYQLRHPAMMSAELKAKKRDDNSDYRDIPDAIKTLVDQRLKKAFVVYENIKTIEFADPVAGSPCLVDKPFLEPGAGAGTRYVLDGSANWATGATAFDPKIDDREIHITICHAAYSSRAKNFNPTHTLTSFTQTVKIAPTTPGYAFFKFTPSAANSPNIQTAPFSWKADMAAVTDDHKMFKPALEFESEAGPDGSGAQPKKLSISEVNQALAPVEIDFADTVLTVPEKQKIEDYVTTAFTDDNALRTNGNKIKFKIVGQSGNDGDDTRFQAVLGAIKSKYTSTAKKVLFHPGVANDGTPLTGPMSDVTVAQPHSLQVKYTLPQRASATDPLKPGDLAGAASATKCPISVEISADGTYAINGNAGSGSQLLVLRSTVAGSCAATVCHELGHSMGMTIMARKGGLAMPTPPGLPAVKHVDGGGTYYIDDPSDFAEGRRNRHAGPHCCFGMPASKKADSKFSDWSTGSGDEVCIMWGEGGTDDDRKNFCQTCIDYLKGRKLADVRGAWAGRGAADG